MNFNLNNFLCNSKIKNIANNIHILTILISLFGVIYQIYCIKNKYLLSPILYICITLVILFRIPNQICVALEEKNGWTSVIGSIISCISFIYLSYLTYNYKK